MEKRVFLAILISFGILALSQAYFAPPPPTPAAQSAASSTTPAAPAVPSAVGSAPLPAGQAAPVPGQAEAVTSTSAVPARDITVDTDTVSAVFTTQGGELKSWKLKRYHDHSGLPLELVPQALPEQFERPLTLAVDDPAVSATLRSAIFEPSAPSLTLGGSAGTLEFTLNAAGINARKRIQFQPEGKAYVMVVDASVSVADKSQPVTVHWGPAVALGYAEEGSQPHPNRAIQMIDKVARITASDLEKQKRYDAVLRFAGVEDQYFLSAVLPPVGPSAVRVDYQPLSLPVPNDAQNRTRALIAYSVRTPSPASLTFFSGPKDLDTLRAVDPELTGAIDFGMFRFLVVPLLQALKGINKYLGNYGWSIVALTVFINLLIFPFRHRSMVSMRKMQAIQPEVKVIQERYAKYKITDPERQKMNQEMMALYKQRGVNPASGCVPMLATMPVLFAFYAMLSASIELRGAPFFGWLHDLSVKDPYYITPVLMGATMFWQQKMMPSTADPVQQKMFLLMPVIFTTMFLAAPSGLVVYWFVSNLLAIGQQTITNRLIGAPPPRPPAAPAKAIGNGSRK